MSIYRNVVWMAKGFREYTNGGYERASKLFNNADLEVDLSKRAIMVTGSNSGIGKVTALEVAKRGATVYMVCRNKENGEAARKEIIEKSKNEKIHLFIVDLSQPREVCSFTRAFLASSRPLNILVNNAGCMINTRETVEETIEKNFATNTLGTYILIKALIPLISQAEKPRILTVTSGGMLVQKLDISDLQSEKLKKFDATFVYAQNKRQQVVITDYYAKKNPSIFFATMHPGWSDTPAVQKSMPFFRKIMSSFLRKPEEGADTLVWLCAYENLERLENGSFFQDRVPVAKHLPLAWSQNTPEEAAELIKKLDDLYEKFNKAT